MSVSNFARYANGKLSVDTKLIDFSADNFSVILLTNAHTPDLETHAAYSDVSGDEASGTGYTAGGVDIGPLTGSLDGTSVVWAPTTDAVWTGASFACKYAVVVHRAGGSLTGTDMLIGYSDLNVGAGNITLVSSPLTLQWSGLGLFRH